MHMPENPLEEARLDHVSDTGELIIAAGRSTYVVQVDEALERAVLEAKQIKSEAQKFKTVQSAGALPISQIQSLIRAGADPARVAERYRISETLVRHFSTAIETEKQYAIEQFLAVPAPKESRVRSVSELIERTLAVAHITMESVAWAATRRDLEPWRIIAQFDSASRKVRAEWTWNMHDNAVVCVNATARKLLGERNGGEPDLAAGKYAGKGDGSETEDSAGQTGQTGQTVNAPSVWGIRQASDKASVKGQRRGALAAGSSADGVSSQSHEGGIDASGQQEPKTSDGDTPGHGRFAPAHSAPSPSKSAKSKPVQRGHGKAGTQSLDTLALVADDVSAVETEAVQDSGKSDNAGRNTLDLGDSDTGHGDLEPGPSESPTATAADQKPQKRKSGRSAVPSWDEILFGE